MNNTTVFIAAAMLAMVMMAIVLMFVWFRLHRGEKQLNTIEETGNLRAGLGEWILVPGHRGLIRVNGWLLCPACGEYLPKLGKKIYVFCPCCGNRHPFMHHPDKDIMVPQLRRFEP